MCILMMLMGILCLFSYKFDVVVRMLGNECLLLVSYFGMIILVKVSYCIRIVVVVVIMMMIGYGYGMCGFWDLLVLEDLMMNFVEVDVEFDLIMWEFCLVWGRKL